MLSGRSPITGARSGLAQSQRSDPSCATGGGNRWAIVNDDALHVSPGMHGYCVQLHISLCMWLHLRPPFWSGHWSGFIGVGRPSLVCHDRNALVCRDCNAFAMPSSAFAPRSEGPRTPKREKPAENERRHKPMRMFGFGTRKNRLSEGGNKTEDLALPSSPKHDTPRRRGWMPAFFASRVSKQSRYVKRSQVEADKVAVEEPNAHAQMKMRLAALDVQRGRLLRQISVTGAAITDATDASKQLRDYVGFMLEDFRIDLHKPAWMAAIYAVAEFAALNSVNALRETGKDAAGRTLVPLASEMLLQLRKAEPSIEPHSAILLIRNEKSHGALGVVAATAAAAEQSQRAKNGAIWKPTSPNPLSMESFKVLTSERQRLLTFLSLISLSRSRSPSLFPSSLSLTNLSLVVMARQASARCCDRHTARWPRGSAWRPCCSATAAPSGFSSRAARRCLTSCCEAWRSPRGRSSRGFGSGTR